MKYQPFNLSGFVAMSVFFGGMKTPIHAANAETYVLAKSIYVSPVGTLMTKEMTMEVKDAVMKMRAGVIEVPGSMTRTAMSKETLEVISPTKIRQVTTENKSESKMLLNGMEQPSPVVPEVLLNKPIIFELKDGKWTCGLENLEKPTAEQSKSLMEKEEIFNKDPEFHMYGATPRKIGDEWNVDPSKIGFAGCSNITGDYLVKFTEVKEIRGVKCAILKTTFDFKGEMISGPDDSDQTMTMKGEAIATRSIKDMQDLEVQINATMIIEGSSSEGVTMHIEGPMKSVQKMTIKRP